MIEAKISVTNFTVNLIEHKVAKVFVIANHYSQTCPEGQRFNFGLFDGSELIGVAIFGKPAGIHQAKFYYPTNPTKLLELRRLVCIDATPKNTESYFISQCIKYMKKK